MKKIEKLPWPGQEKNESDYDMLMRHFTTLYSKINEIIETQNKIIKTLEKSKKDSGLMRY